MSRGTGLRDDAVIHTAVYRPDSTPQALEISCVGDTCSVNRSALMMPASVADGSHAWRQVS